MNTPDNYTYEQMMRDHEHTVRQVFGPDYKMVSVDEQEIVAEALMEDEQ